LVLPFLIGQVGSKVGLPVPPPKPFRSITESDASPETWDV
jgi:hypothetical protein